MELVLLKNNNEALPLAESIKTVAVFGKTSYEIITGGTGSGDVNEGYSVSLIEGLNKAGYSIDEATMSIYQNYMKEEEEKVESRWPISRFWIT